MLQEIETMILSALKLALNKPEITIAEFQALYTIFRDLKVIAHGQTNNSETKPS